MTEIDPKVQEATQDQTDIAVDTTAKATRMTTSRRSGKRGRKPAKIDVKAKLERSRQSARECRARKKLRYQYLEELVSSREKAIFTLRQELETYRQGSMYLDKGKIPAEMYRRLEVEHKKGMFDDSYGVQRTKHWCDVLSDSSNDSQGSESEDLEEDEFMSNQDALPHVSPGETQTKGKGIGKSTDRRSATSTLTSGENVPRWGGPSGRFDLGNSDLKKTDHAPSDLGKAQPKATAEKAPEPGERTKKLLRLLGAGDSLDDTSQKSKSSHPGPSMTTESSASVSWNRTQSSTSWNMPKQDLHKVNQAQNLSVPSSSQSVAHTELTRPSQVQAQPQRPIFKSGFENLQFEPATDAELGDLMDVIESSGYML